MMQSTAEIGTLPPPKLSPDQLYELLRNKTVTECEACGGRIFASSCWCEHCGAVREPKPR